MFSIISRICKYLPCPECSRDATMALSKIDLNNYKTKESLRDMFYLFHNWVNTKKRKPLYNHINVVKYSRLNLIAVVNTFILNYNTKGNMNMLTESFQRDFVLNDFKKWFRYYRMAFLPDMIINNPKPVNIETVENVTIEEQILDNLSHIIISENSVDEIQESVDTNSDETEVINETENDKGNEVINEPENDIEKTEEFQEVISKKKKPRKKRVNSKK
jgi:hypothetical protein